MEADGPANTKTRERTEGAATAVQAMHGLKLYYCTKRSRWTEDLDQFRREGRTSRSPLQGRRFGRGQCYVARVVSPILGDVLINSHWWLSSHRQSLHSNGDNFNQPPLRFHSTEETDSEASSKERNLRTSTSYALYDSSIFQESNLPAAFYYRKVVETKSRQNRTFDLGGSQGHPRACPFLGSWRALVLGEVIRAGAAG